MSTLSLPAVQSLLLEDIDWKTYTRLLRAFAERRSLRLTYDCGSLEIMTLTHEHESYAHLLGRLQKRKGLSSDVPAAEYHRLEAELALSRAKSGR